MEKEINGEKIKQKKEYIKNNLLYLNYNNTNIL